jgi:hypothetical protein
MHSADTDAWKVVASGSDSAFACDNGGEEIDWPGTASRSWCGQMTRALTANHIPLTPPAAPASPFTLPFCSLDYFLPGN